MNKHTHPISACATLFSRFSHSLMAQTEERSEIAFFDLETTMRRKEGQGVAILEFGAILVCPKKLKELDSYSTLVRPSDPSLISSLPDRNNGITGDAIRSAPTFADIADKVYDILHGRIWAGHNILRFDCPIIREAFAVAGRPAPEPKGTIDSLDLLTQRFGRRAGDMKMATLATYFGLRQQTHRSLDDVRMNLKVLKCCATVLFLESSTAALSEGSSGFARFIEPDEVSTPVQACLVFEGSQFRRMKLLHKDVILQLCCPSLGVRFGISKMYGWSFVVDAPPSLCEVLEACDAVARKFVVESGSSSEWIPVITRKFGFHPTARLRIPTKVHGGATQYATEIYHKQANGTTQKLVFQKFDVAELESLIKPGTLMDAFLSLDPYDYDQRSAGIRLVAKKLIIHREDGGEIENLSQAASSGMLN